MFNLRDHKRLLKAIQWLERAVGCHGSYWNRDGFPEKPCERQSSAGLYPFQERSIVRRVWHFRL